MSDHWMAKYAYRFYNGEIQTQRFDGSWMRSAHDDAPARDLPDYEKDNHPALPALREKFAAKVAS